MSETTTPITDAERDAHHNAPPDQRYRSMESVARFIERRLYDVAAERDAACERNGNLSVQLAAMTADRDRARQANEVNSSGLSCLRGSTASR